ncbi:hypothetical protein [Methylobrevis albus]|uniref:Uncharacterized protein n=1 Tax=Methylobrevis albus TaxID=2793297 RepID=A0A931I200_9HYPH|nr:hypothetical protein [Methylobrevis albus]MBH0237944.1 hypothetical protein [Methylobrevis albus]
MTTPTPNRQPIWRRFDPPILEAYAPGRRPDGTDFGAEDEEDEDDTAAEPEASPAPGPAPKAS